MRSYGETFKRFAQCIKWAKQGKTFIYWHPDFVAIDMKTWEEIEQKLNPRPIIYYDEYSEVTPENLAKIDKILSQRIKL